MKEFEKAERNPASPFNSDQNHVPHVVIITSEPVNRNFPAGLSDRILMLLCDIIWASLPVSRDSWQYCKNLAANFCQAWCFGQYFNLWCFLHVESYLLIHVQPDISHAQSSFPMSPGQQQEDERGLNVLASCGEAKAVRLNSVQRPGSRVHPSVLAGFAHCRDISASGSQAWPQHSRGRDVACLHTWYIYGPCHGETLGVRDPTLYNRPLSFPRDSVYITLPSEQAFTRSLFCEERLEWWLWSL